MTSHDALVGAIELAPKLESLMQLAFHWCESQTDFLRCVSSAYALVATEEFIPEQYAQISEISAWNHRRLEEMPEASSAVLDDVAMKGDALQAHMRRDGRGASLSQRATSNRVSQAELEQMHEAHRILYGGLWVSVDRPAGRAELSFPNDSDAGITRRTGPDGREEFVIRVTFETELPNASNELPTAISDRTAPSLDDAIDLVKAYMLQRKWITQEEFEFNHRSLIDGHYWSRAREWARFSADGPR